MLVQSIVVARRCVCRELQRDSVSLLREVCKPPLHGDCAEVTAIAENTVKSRCVRAQRLRPGLLLFEEYARAALLSARSSKDQVDAEKFDRASSSLLTTARQLTRAPRSP